MTGPDSNIKVFMLTITYEYIKRGSFICMNLHRILAGHSRVICEHSCYKFDYRQDFVFAQVMQFQAIMQILIRIANPMGGFAGSLPIPRTMARHRIQKPAGERNQAALGLLGVSCGEDFC
jgi:hypothetical protein